MFLKEQGKEPLNTQFLPEQGHGLPAVRWEEKWRPMVKAKSVNTTMGSELFVAAGDHQGGRGPSALELPTMAGQSLWQKGRGTTGVGGEQEVPCSLLLLHCRGTRAPGARSRGEMD